jgi:hypothetical protein
MQVEPTFYPLKLQTNITFVFSEESKVQPIKFHTCLFPKDNDFWKVRFINQFADNKDIFNVPSYWNINAFIIILNHYCYDVDMCENYKRYYPKIHNFCDVYHIAEEIQDHLIKKIILNYIYTFQSIFYTQENYKFSVASYEKITICEKYIKVSNIQLNKIAPFQSIFQQFGSRLMKEIFDNRDIFRKDFNKEFMVKGQEIIDLTYHGSWNINLTAYDNYRTLDKAISPNIKIEQIIII